LDLEDLQTFYNGSFSKLGTAKKEFESSLATVEANIRWIKLHQKKIGEWLAVQTKY
jgi:hypothetical protein